MDIEKEGTEIIRINVNEFKGRKYLDIRNFYKGADGEYLPTKKGISIPLELKDKVLEAIKEL